MTEFIEDKGTWCGIPTILQGIVSDGEVIAIKMIDPSDMTPLSWALDPKKESKQTKCIVKVLQYLYDEKKEKGVIDVN